eukprot:Nk52_evm23s2325 gene=Nk52_evmTU23s2325
MSGESPSPEAVISFVNAMITKRGGKAGDTWKDALEELRRVLKEDKLEQAELDHIQSLESQSPRRVSFLNVTLMISNIIEKESGGNGMLRVSRDYEERLSQRGATHPPGCEDCVGR